MYRFRTADDLTVFGNLSEGLYQAFGILPRVAYRSEEPRLPTIVRVSLVQKIVEHLAAIDHGQASVAELHVAQIVPRCASRLRSVRGTVSDLRPDRPARTSQDNRFDVRLHHQLHANFLADSLSSLSLR